MPGTAKNKGKGVDLPKQQTLLCVIRKSCIIEAFPIRGREKAKWDLSQAFIVFLEGSVLISPHSKCLRTGIAWALGTASNNGKETGVLLQLALFSETGKMCYFFKWASTSEELYEEHEESRKYATIKRKKNTSAVTDLPQNLQ